MAMGYHVVKTATIVTDSTFSSEVNIAGFNRIAIEVPTFDAGLSTDSANVYVNVAETEGGTYRRLKDMGAYSSTSGIQDWEVPRTIGNYTVLCRPASGFHWMKLEVAQGATFNATSTAGLSCKVYCAE